MVGSMSLQALQAQWKKELSYRGTCRRCLSPRVWHNGIRLRKASLRDGDRTVFVTDLPVRRLVCGDCRNRWSHAPTGVPSRAHYQPCVVAEVVTQAALEEQARDGTVAKAHGCHRRTVLRLVARVANLVEPSQLMRRLLQESGATVIPAVPPAIRTRRSAALFAQCQRAVLVLALLEALSSVRGLCPPGLCHAAHFMPADVSPWETAIEAAFGGERRTQNT